MSYKELWTKIFINLPYLKAKLRITFTMSFLQTLDEKLAVFVKFKK
ncbi:hypothetical protein SULYE_1239 [Sulfurihydrogenibium yellowstonense SS-5]|uniref:Uncharacterized protein n=1 Tax=Sulfurihydrogenibium yellowstonense SS-5 TaxID=432331 RepID=C4FKY6_9AQUI|nr:hypothetical protein SULYE_1239 [Sulfurihydrogenibium yellowstonense SS-5]